MRIYTRGGDTGETGLFDGSRVSKDHLRVSACGDVDETCAQLGVARSWLAGEQRLADVDAALEAVQRDLFAIGALLGDPRRDEGDPADVTAPDAGQRARAARVDLEAARATELEQQIDAWESELVPLTRFILPGGTHAAASLHACRTTCRRAERSVVRLAATGGGSLRVLTYLNRLSDWLFVAARIANHRTGQPDVAWK